MVSGPAGICVNWSVDCAEFGTDLEQMFHGSPLQPMGLYRIFSCKINPARGFPSLYMYIK